MRSFLSTFKRGYTTFFYEDKSRRTDHEFFIVAPQPNKEWKPKSSQKASIIGAPAKSVSPPADHSEYSETDVAQLQDKLSQ
ncbi:unnamed protein product [Ilex paraguariensis]|uniref:Uncharacterized protein n=1 Tax=Ilex paraguariensis TaxID=185542 RepID=A0ABC8UFX0_9AQUA